MTARRTPRSRPRTTTPRLSSASTLFAIGEVLADTYEIKRVLGSGGMGQVFDAHDRALNRRVAVKAHWPHLAEFPIRKEAQALAAIRHPSVVTVHAVAKHQGVDFMVMERIPGITLADHLERAGRALPIADVVDTLARLAEGLAAVHAAGIAHRDVKPANVMMAPGNRLVLTDFGIFLPEFDVSDAAAAGTLDYMAPEAIARRVTRGDAYLVDVYALGIVAFELLTGARAFAGDLSALIHQHLNVQPARVTARRPDVPDELADLVAAMLHKDPTERPASMQGICTMLRSMGSRRGTRPISVVIGEDDRALADVLSDFVTEVAPDATVRVARDGSAVLAHVRQSPPDLLLLDLGLPLMNGVELCMYLRGSKLAADTRIVAMSAAARAQDVNILKQLGIGSFIRKGNDWLDRVEDAVREARRAGGPTPSASRSAVG